MLIFLSMLAAAAASPQGAAPPAPWADPAKACFCEEKEAPETVVFRGVVSGAQTRLAPNGRSVLPRQAVIFTLLGKPEGDGPDPITVWYSAEKRACMKFDYGKQYKVKARKAGDEFETDACLMREANGIVAQPE